MSRSDSSALRMRKPTGFPQDRVLRTPQGASPLSNPRPSTNSHHNNDQYNSQFNNTQSLHELQYLKSLKLLEKHLNPLALLNHQWLPTLCR